MMKNKKKKNLLRRKVNNKRRKKNKKNRKKNLSLFINLRSFVKKKEKIQNERVSKEILYMMINKLIDISFT